MNRRLFFKSITGLCAGVVAAFVPNRITASPVVSQKLPKMRRKKGSTCGITTETYGTPDMLYEKRSGTEFVCNALCDCFQQDMREVGGRIMIICPHLPPYFVNDDGSKSFECDVSSLTNARNLNWRIWSEPT